MKKKIDIKSMLAGALLATLIVLSAGAAADSRTDWQYRVITGHILGDPGTQDKGRLDNRINSHVAEGWHFVSASGIGERSGFAVMRREKQ